MRVRRFLAGAALCSALLLAHDPSAEACLNGVRDSIHATTRLVHQVTEALSAGNSARALKLLEDRLGADDRFDASDPKVEQKLEQLLVVARLREGGQPERQEAITRLRGWQAGKPEDPWLQTRIAEALSRAADGFKEAGEILERLVKRDLIVDPEGFAALARTRQAAGDAQGAAAALSRCKAMATRPALCTAALPTLKPIPPRPPSEKRGLF